MAAGAGARLAQGPRERQRRRGARGRQVAQRDRAHQALLAQAALGLRCRARALGRPRDGGGAGAAGRRLGRRRSRVLVGDLALALLAHLVRRAPGGYLHLQPWQATVAMCTLEEERSQADTGRQGC